MPRPGHCPQCDLLFDSADHMPMVSVVCGHSLCSACANVAPARAPDHDDAASTSSDSTASDDDDASPRPAPRCPVCNASLAGFVKNFELLSALQRDAPPRPAPPHRAAPDLKSVVTPDLVVDRAAVHFARTPANEVGKGASAVVYRGTFAGMPVAVKCIRTMSDSFTREDRLRRELRNASALKNPHIVEFRAAAWDHEAGPASPRNILLVTELMAGGNLRESLNHLPDEHGLALHSFVHIALQISRGIQYLHAEGLAHRDIKSANILLTERLPPYSNRFSNKVRAKIADFGLSKYIDKATGGGTVMQSIMEPGRLEATYSYLAPEAFGGDKSNVIRRPESDDEDDVRYDEMAKKRDIYALGVLFWEVLTGRIPWSGVSLPDVYVRVCVRSDRPGPALDDAKVSKSVRRLVERCWAQNPLKRPSAKSIVAKLEKLAVKYGVASDSSSAAAAAAAVESVSVISGQGPNPATTPASPGRVIPDMHSEPLKEHTDQRELPQQRAPSDSLMSYQKMPSASTVYTTQNEGSKTHSTGFEPSDARDLMEDVPGQFDDTVWEDDGDVNGKGHLQRIPPGTPAATTAAVTAAAVHTDTGENAPSPHNRRIVRPRHHAAEPVDGTQGRPVHTISGNHLASATSSVTPASPSPSPNPHGKSSATAVAATAAAIAAAKDRERKRDDVRGVRGPNTRVARPANAPGGETSFQSLPGSAEGLQRTNTKEREQRAVFYDNSDEEAEDFDPERAAAEEAMAESNGRVASNQRHPNIVARAQSHNTRSVSANRVARPISPVVRRPMSPGIPRPFSPVVSQSRVATDDDTAARSGQTAAPKTSDTASAKKTTTTSRGRLGRTMSASNGAANRASTPMATASSQTPVGSTSESSGKRAFIRRMRSNEASRRIARSSSSTGVEHRRPKQPPPKTTPSHASDTVPSEDGEDAEYTVVQIGSGTKEDFLTTVNALDKAGLMRLLAQRMIPLRLAALAHAALQSPKHRNDEEVLRNSCAILHRLTVPGNSTQQKNSVQEISAKEQLSIRKYLKSTQGVESLLQAMHPPHIRHPTTLSYGLLALGNLTAWDLEAHRQFRNSHGVIQIAKVMKTHIKNAGVQEKGCYALACVGAAYPAKSKPIFEQTGALDVVIGALSEVQRDSPNDAVTKQACAALGAMCSSSPPNAVYSGRKEALTYLVTAFERFRRASRVDGGKRSEMRLVCKAFIDLLCHAENRKLAGSKGGSTMIIRAMRIFRLDADFIEKGLTTLSDFCTYRSNGTQIVQANGVDDIVAAMERFRMSVVMQREGSRVLTLLMKATGDQARRRLVHAGGAEAIVFALERFSAVPENNVPVVVETCRALHMLFMMENSAEGEILGRRMRKIKCDKAIKTAMATHKGSQAVQEKGRDALKQLGTLKGGVGLWGRMRSGPKKR